MDPVTPGQMWSFSEERRHHPQSTEREPFTQCILRSLGLEEAHGPSIHRQRGLDYRHRSYSSTSMDQAKEIIYRKTLCRDAPEIPSHHQRAASTGMLQSSVPPQRASLFPPTAEQDKANMQSTLPMFSPPWAVWVNTRDASLAADSIHRKWSAEGSIKTIHVLPKQKCPCPHFFLRENALHAKETSWIGMRKGQSQETVETWPDTSSPQPTRSLWIGNVSSHITVFSLEQLFYAYGSIESVRILSLKNCAFINFKQTESAVAAKQAMTRSSRSTLLKGTRIGFAKTPTLRMSSQSSERATEKKSNTPQRVADHGQSLLQELQGLQGLQGILEECGVEDALTAATCNTSIPPVPKRNTLLKQERSKLREMKRKLAEDVSEAAADAIACQCIEDIVELCSVQHLFKKCSEQIRTSILERLGPHLASWSVHKNGTWAAQKIIEKTTSSPHNKIQLLCRSLQPYTPSLMLDPLGNYAIQCCLSLGPEHTPFLFHALACHMLLIAQGRFGARAVRRILESPLVTRQQQQQIVASSLLYHLPVLAMHANGAILFTWLLESNQMKDHLHVMASVLVPHLPTLCTHKLGSHMVLKLINQATCARTQHLILTHLMDLTVIHSVLADTVRGLLFIQKTCKSPFLPSLLQHSFVEVVCCALTDHHGLHYTKLWHELI
ncbi:armadillo-type protein [Spinellus fusiger]|nr:armadillo-type protein [Spinellus fusiger]